MSTVDTKAAVARLHALSRHRRRHRPGGGDRARHRGGAERGRRAARARSVSTTPTRASRVPTQTGNLIVELPGRGALHNQPRLMFMTHMDTVPLCAGAKPKRAGPQDRQHGRRPRSAATTAPAARVLVTLAAELARQKLDHPPITLLFCVREESGLWGARHVDPADLGAPVMAFNYDGGSASDIVVGAVGADRWEVEIFGRASHAGGAPERGISVDDDPRPGARRDQGRRLVRQGGERQEAGHQQCRAGDRRRRPARRRRHQRGDRLRACARRKPQPRPEVLQGRSPPPTRPRSRRPRRTSRTAKARPGGSSSRCRPTIIRSA